MALNSGALILPGRGTVFYGDVDETPPTVAELATISPTSPPTGWTCLGHTSRENAVSLGKEGGDATQMGSWWDDAIYTSYDPVQWSMTINSLQVDADTLGLAFGGGTLNSSAGTFSFANTSAVDKALLVLMVDPTKRLGIYTPNTSISLGDAPEIYPTAFFEIQLAAQLLTSSTLVPATRIRFIGAALQAA